MEVTKFTAAEKSGSRSQQCQGNVDRFFSTSKALSTRNSCPLGQTVNGKWPLQNLAKMKLRLKGRGFDTTEEIHTTSQEVIDTFTFENIQGCMK